MRQRVPSPVWTTKMGLAAAEFKPNLPNDERSSEFFLFSETIMHFDLACQRVYLGNAINLR